MRLPVRVSLALLLLLTAGGRGGSAQDIIAVDTDERGWSSQIKNEPLQILFAESPALLIQIDGDPVYRGVEGADLDRIVNTRALIVRERAGIHYLKVLDGWMEWYALMGDWSVSGVPPPGGTEALERAVDAKAVDLLDGRGSQEVPSLATQAPTIVISSAPAVLIVTNGPARYQTVEGTSLEYLVNTTANVFWEPTDQELYVLAAGRWFRAWTTDGPWEFISSDELPADIAAWIAKSRKHDEEHMEP